MIRLYILVYNMSCSYSDCSSKPVFLCDNCTIPKLFCIEHAEFHKSELNHSMKSSSNPNQFRIRNQFEQNHSMRSSLSPKSLSPRNQSEMSLSLNPNPLGPRNQSKKISIHESVSEFIATSEIVILAVRKICFKKIKRLRKGRGFSRLSFNIKDLIKNLSDQGIIEQGSRFFSSQEIDNLYNNIDKKEKRINELEKITLEFNRNSQNLFELSTTISNMKQKDERIAELQELASEIKVKDQKIAELQGLASEIKVKDLRIAELHGLASEIKIRDQRIAELEKMITVILDENEKNNIDDK